MFLRQTARRLSGLLLGLVLLITAGNLGLTPSIAQAKTEEPINLKMQVAIPEYTPDFSSKSTRPIAEYVRAVAKYATGVVGIVATIVMMFGGVLWLTAAGDSGKISEAKAWVTSSLFGLLLALTSYMILATINPDLVEFKTTSLKYVDPLGCCETANVCGLTPKSECAGGWHEGTNFGCDETRKCTSNTQKLTTWLEKNRLDCAGNISELLNGDSGASELYCKQTCASKGGVDYAKSKKYSNGGRIFYCCVCTGTGSGFNTNTGGMLPAH